MLKISVIIPTYNRANDVKDAIDCLLKQETNNEFDFEIIVVDNNSKDNTKETVETYINRFPGRLTYLFEPKQGRAYALNAGLKIADGDIICRVDDDCLLEKDYLWNIKQVFQNAGPDVGVLGGKIYPKWIGQDYPYWLDKIFSQPVKLEDGSFNWLKLTFEGALGIFDLGRESFILDYTQKDHSDIQFFGANTSFRKNVLDKHGDFNAENILGEDTEMCRRLFNAGIKGVYAPDVWLYHKVPTSNGTPRFFYKWWFIRGVHMMDFEEKSIIIGISKIIYVSLKSLLEKDIFKKIRFRWQAFYILGQMMKLIKQMSHGVK